MILRQYVLKSLSLLLLIGTLAGETQLSRTEQVDAALRALYKMEYQTATRRFRSLQESDSGSVFAPLGLMVTRWYANQQTRGHRQANQRLAQEIEPVLSHYRQQLQQKPGNAELIFFYGVTLGVKGRIQLARKDWLGILLTGYRAISYIKKADRLDPHNPDILLAKGVFNYYVGISAAYMQLASWMLNMSGSKELGLRQLETAAGQAQYGKYEAMGLLAFIYLYIEAEYAQALAYCRDLQQLFPENPYYTFLLADAHIINDHHQEAGIWVQTLKDSLPTLRGFTKIEYAQKLNYLEGSLALNQGDLPTAMNKLDHFIEQHDMELDFTLAHAYLRAGMARDLWGERAKARVYYRQAIALDNRTSACERAKKYLDEPYRGTAVTAP